MPVILIVDDNETIREGLAHMVKKLGHEAIIATSGDAGVAAFKKRPADFVITDLKMEGGTGVDVLKGISAIPSRRPDHDHHRLRHRRDGGRSDEARRVRLHHQADPARSRAAQGRERARAVGRAQGTQK